MTTIGLETLTLAKSAMKKYVGDKIDWEQRRYEVAKEILPQVYAVVCKILEAGGDVVESSIGKQCAVTACMLADNLINELK